MLRKSFLVFFISLAIFIGSLSAEWVSMDQDNARGTTPRIQVISSDENHITIQVNLPGFYKIIDKNGMSILSIPGNATTESLGKSAVPIVSGTIALPDNVINVKLTEHQNLDTKEYKGIYVYPFQKPLKDGEPEGVFIKDNSHYQSNDLFPEKTLTLDKVGVWRSQKVVTFRLIPMQIKPATGFLYVNSKVQFTLSYDLGRSEFKKASNSSDYENMYQKLLINYTPDRSSKARGSYVFICANSALATAVQPLVDRRKAQGYQVLGPYTLSDVGGSTSTDIKNYITNLYNTQGIEYAVIVGDPSELPIYMWGTYPSDYWLSCLAGDDMFADIKIGRICTTDPAVVANYISKIEAYENYVSNDNDWAVKALLIAHKEGAPGKYEGCMEEVFNATYTYKVELDKCYGSVGTNTNDTIIQIVNSGRAIVAYRGHGDTNCWYGWNGTSFYTTNMDTLANSPVFPVFFSIACNTSEIDSATETLAEVCLKSADRGGCAYLGATRPSYTVPNHDFCKFLFKATYTEGLTTVGAISNSANAGLVNLYGPTSYAMDNVKMYFWLGDPGTKLHVLSNK